MRRKRSQFPCNKWISRGQVVRTASGSTAEILDVSRDGVTIGRDGWSCTWHWPVVFRERAGMGPMVRVWRPATS